MSSKEPAASMPAAAPAASGSGSAPVNNGTAAAAPAATAVSGQKDNKPAKGTMRSPAKHVARPATTAGASLTSSAPPVDFTKEWSNGHKFFNSTQTRAFAELLHTEEHTRQVYDQRRDQIRRPRNPLNGDHSPRDQRGELVLNPRLLFTVKNSLLLFDHKDSAGREWHEQQYPEKIGVQRGRYNVLGNTCVNGIDAANNEGDQFDLYRSIRMENEKRTQLNAEREKMNECIVREKAKRYEKELNRQMSVLQRKMDEKHKEMDFLQSTMRR